MMIQGMAGFHRRAFDGGAAYEQTTNVPWGPFESLLTLNEVTTWGAWLLAIAQVPFIINLFGSIKWGKKAEGDNPWHATTLDWGCPTPPPHGNFPTEPVIYRDPYEYSVPGAPRDYTLQYEPDPGAAEAGKKKKEGAAKS